MARRVAAELTLEAAQYLAEARLVEKTTASVDHEMDQLNRSIDRVERSEAQLAATSAVAARQVDNLGDQARGAGRDFSLLEARIFASRARIRELNLEIASTGGADKSLFKQLRSEQSGLRELERVAKAAAASSGSPVAGISAAGQGGGIGRLSATNPYVIAGILTAVSAAGPAIGAMVGGIVAGAIGTVGVAGGLLSAAKSPQVIGAAHEFGDAIGKEFFRGGENFVGPAIESMHILEKAFMDMKVPEAFEKMAPTVEIIAGGLGDLGRNIMPGLNKAFDRMGPFANAAADGFAELGDEFGTFMDDVTSSPGAVLGLRAAFSAIGGTVVFLGKEIKFLSDAFGGLLMIAAKAGQSGFIKFLSFGTSTEPAEAMERWANELFRIRDSSSDASYSVDQFGESTARATEEAEIFNKALKKSYSAFLDFVGAEISAEAAVDNLADAFKEHGTTLDVDTEAGRDNLGLLKQLAESAMEATQKKLAETHSVEEANAVYNTYRQKLYDTFIQAGKTAEEAQALVDKWLALDALADIDKYINIHQTTYRVTYGPSPDVPFGGGFQEFAEGGMVQGPPGSAQLVVAHAGERVLTPAQQWNGGVYGGGGAGWAAQPFMYSGSNQFEAAMIESIRTAVAARGGQLAVLNLKAPR